MYSGGSSWTHPISTLKAPRVGVWNFENYCSREVGTVLGQSLGVVWGVVCVCVCVRVRERWGREQKMIKHRAGGIDGRKAWDDILAPSFTWTSGKFLSYLFLALLNYPFLPSFFPHPSIHYSSPSTHNPSPSTHILSIIHPSTHLPSNIQHPNSYCMAFPDLGIQ